MLKNDLLIAPACEAALLFVAALAAWVTHKPLIFASLGPTAYELVETPERRSARPYNVVAGHLIGVLSGYFALFVTDAWSSPMISAGWIGWRRVAVVLAAAATVFVTLLINAAQPAGGDRHHFDHRARPVSKMAGRDRHHVRSPADAGMRRAGAEVATARKNMTRGQRADVWLKTARFFTAPLSVAILVV
jgi:hypothetical protein